jgi:eukaryotic-like serine/threonine-protein kinase
MVGSPPASSDPLVGTILGRYLLVRRLGEGGMGAVYEAVHQDLGRRAAIKTLHAHYAESTLARSRFLREGQAASRIHHPNAADVYDVGIDESQPYLVMELLEGETLARIIAREGPLSVQRTADILLPVVAAIAAAHDLGVIHRDLKPENIFLSAGRNTLRPKVLDFGISKLILGEQGPALTDTGAFLGTPYYVSPEQARGAKIIDVRSDQYSIGVILYECVTARRPVEEPSLYAMIQRIVHGDFAPPRQLNPSLPSAFEAVILKAMARFPTGRFTTTRELGEALLEFASARVRASYADELSSGPSTRHTPNGRDAPDEDLGMSTTIGESAVQRDAPRAGRSVWPRAALVALVAAVGAVVVVALCTSSPERRPGSDAGASAANVALAAPW